MKKIFLLTSIFLFSLCSCAKEETLNKKAEIPNFVTGDISIKEIKADKKFLAHHHTKVSQEELALIKTIKEPITIVTYFGLWCHDSKREVPQLIELLEAAENKNIEHNLIALDIKKQEPNNRQDKDNVKFTPTIIISKDGKEMGRIIEKPKTSLASDIVNFLKN